MANRNQEVNNNVICMDNQREKRKDEQKLSGKDVEEVRVFKTILCVG